MASSTSVFSGVVHGKTIELERAPGLPDGQAVSVTIQGIGQPEVPGQERDLSTVDSWIDRLVFDPTVLPGERIVKGTRLAAESLVAELSQPRSDEELLRSYPELSPDDLEALRQYARLPEGLRRSFGGWAEDAEELDKYLEWTRQQRKTGRREILG